MDQRWKEYWNKRVDNLKSQVHITEILEAYGIDIRTKSREFQFPCPLHGDGNDRSYSARMYPQDGDSGGTYCFACQKNRDIIQWVMDYEGLSFQETIKLIEKKFDVKNIPSPGFDPENETQDTQKVTLEKKNDEFSVENALDLVENKADRVFKENRNELSYKKVSLLYYYIDSLRYDYNKENVSGSKVEEALTSIIESIQDISNAKSI